MLFVCYPKCSTCAKARKWLEEQGISFEERDIKTDNPTEAELRDWHRRSGLPLKRFFNTSGLQYKALGLKDRLPEMSEDEQMRCSRPTACSSSVRCSSGRTSRFPASGKRNGGKS